MSRDANGQDTFDQDRILVCAAVVVEAWFSVALCIPQQPLVCALSAPLQQHVSVEGASVQPLLLGKMCGFLGLPLSPCPLHPLFSVFSILRFFLRIFCPLCSVFLSSLNPNLELVRLKGRVPAKEYHKHSVKCISTILRAREASPWTRSILQVHFTVHLQDTRTGTNCLYKGFHFKCCAINLHKEHIFEKNIS